MSHARAAEGELILGVVVAGESIDPADRAPPRVGSSEGSAADHQQGRPVSACNRAALDRRIAPRIPCQRDRALSALRGENVDELIATIKRMLPPGPPLLPDDHYTDQTGRMIAEEVVREKIFIAMRQEIPFSTAVRVEQFNDKPSAA